MTIVTRRRPATAGDAGGPESRDGHYHSAPHYTPNPPNGQVPREVLDAIKDRENFPRLFGEVFGITLPRSPNGRGPVMVRCPRPDHPDGTPSCAVYHDHAHCFGCGWHADAFDLVMERDRVGFREAVRILAAQGRYPLSSLTPEQVQAMQTQREYEDGLTRAATFFHQHLLESEAGMEYARSRWSEEAIRAERIGFADGSPLPDLGNEQARQVAEAVNRWAARVGGAVVYAHRRGGRVVYLSARSIREKKHYNPPGRLAGPKQPYVNAVYSSRSEEVIIVEGQACAITLAGWGFPAVALAGSGPSEDLARLLRGERDVYVIPDADGRTDVQGLAEALGPQIIVVTLPDGVADVNDWARKDGTAEALRDRLNEAPEWLERRITEIAEMPKDRRRDREIEKAFRFIADLSIPAQKRYKKIVKDRLGFNVQEFDAMVREARAKEQEQRDQPDRTEAEPPEILDDIPVLHPALDFTDGLAVTTVYLQTKSKQGVSRLPYIVTGGDNRELVRIGDTQMISLAGRQVVLTDLPTSASLKESVRWSYPDIRRYLDGDVPDPREVYLSVEYCFDKYVDFREDGTSDILALWIIGTYLFPLFEAYPYIALLGPKASGKTKVISLITRLAFNAMSASNISSAALFRWVEKTRGTVAIDEAEQLSSRHNPVAQDLRLLLNAGYKDGQPARRVEKSEADQFRVVAFRVYSPKAIASIREPEDVLRSRCIVVRMLRTTTEKGTRIVSESSENWSEIRHGLYCLALTHFEAIRERYHDETLLEGLNNRAAELYRPLLAIAAFLEDEMGVEGILERVRDFARRTVAQANEDSLDDQRTALLLALYRLTEEGDANVTPGEVSRTMTHYLEEGSEITAQWVGYRLREFDFQGRRGRRGRVYQISRQAVEDVMRRYGVSPPQEEQVPDLGSPPIPSTVTEF